MSVDEITKAFAKLSAAERLQLLRRLEEFDAAEVDAKLENDIRNGKYDEMAKQALAEHTAGKTKPL